MENGLDESLAQDRRAWGACVVSSIGNVGTKVVDLSDKSVHSRRQGRKVMAFSRKSHETTHAQIESNTAALFSTAYGQT